MEINKHRSYNLKYLKDRFMRTSIPQMNNFDESNKECNKIVNQNTSNATQRTKIFLNATGIHYDLLLDKNININRIKFNEYSSITKQNQINSEWKNEYNFKSQVQLPDFYDNDNDDDNSSTYSDFFNISLVQNESRDMSQNKKQKKLQKKKEKTPKNNSASSISSNSSSYNYDMEWFKVYFFKKFIKAIFFRIFKKYYAS